MKTIKPGRIAAVLTILGLLMLAELYPFRKKNVNGSFVLNTIETKHGWGYKILLHQHLIVYQESITGRIGSSGFKCRKTAKKAGEMVIDKLGHYRVPSLSKQEVNMLCNMDKISVQEKTEN